MISAPDVGQYYKLIISKYSWAALIRLYSNRCVLRFRKMPVRIKLVLAGEFS